jgi:hypothetical protein
MTNNGNISRPHMGDKRPSQVQFVDEAPSSGHNRLATHMDEALPQDKHNISEIHITRRDSKSSSFNSLETPARGLQGNNRPSTAESNTSRFSEYKTEIEPLDGKFGPLRTKCGRFVNHPLVEHFITFIIFCNTVLLVLSTFDFAKSGPTFQAFDIMDQSFLVIFTIESAMQLIYWDIKLIKNKWLLFDLVLVIASWAFQAFTVLRCLRILKIASKFEALQRLITALLDVIPNITAIFSLLLLVFYIFAVMFTTLFKDLELSRDYFSRLDKTLFSLFQFMTMDWQEAARECQQEIPWAPLLFVLFEIVSGFIVFNLIVAVLCEALGLLEKDAEEEEMQQQIEKERIEAMNSLLERVETIKKHQLRIQQTLRDVAHDHNNKHH